MKPVILAGGKGERIGGDKPLIKLLNRPLICWIFEKAKRINLPVYISVKNKFQEENIRAILLREHKNPKDIIFVKDILKDLGGPIAGIISVMKSINTEEPLLILAVDQPFVEVEALKYMWSLSEIFCNNFLIVPKGKGKIRPFPGIYPSSLSSEIENFIKISQRTSLFRLFNYLKAKNLVLFLVNGKIKETNFININTPEDLREAEKCFYQSLKMLIT